MTKSESIAYLRKLALKEKIAEESLPTVQMVPKKYFVSWKKLKKITRNT